MSDGTHDLQRYVLIIDDDRVPGSGDGDFITLTIPDSYDLGSALGDGQNVASSVQNRVVEATVNCGEQSEAHRVMSVKYAKQEAKRLAREKHNGFGASGHNPQNGERVTSSTLLITKGADMGAGQAAGMRTWNIAFRSATITPATAIPVGGGSL